MNSKESLKWLKEHHEYLIKQYFDNPFVSKETAFDLANPKFMEIEQHIEELEKKNQELKEEKDFAWEKSRENWAKYQKQCEDVSELLLFIEKRNEELDRYNKSLEILKKKIVNLETLLISADLDTYHEILKDNPFYDKLTQEEFKLLKEMLEEA